MIYIHTVICKNICILIYALMIINNKLNSILIIEEINVCLNLFFSIEYLLHFTKKMIICITNLI